MPTRHGQRGWDHKNAATNKEFERLSRKIDAARDAIADTPAGTNNPANPAAAKEKIRSVSHNDVTKVADVTMLDFQDVASEGLTLNGFYDVYGSQNYGKVKTYAKLPIKTGLIRINILPDNSESYAARDAWKRLNKHIRPDTPYNWYGWAVYNYIDHGWNLVDPNDFILHLVDIDETEIMGNEAELEIEAVNDYVTGVLDEEEMEDEDLVRSVIIDYYNAVYGAFTPKKDSPLVDGIKIKELVTIDGTDYEVEKNIIVLRAVHKPDVPVSYGAPYDGRLDYIDEEKGIVRTNLTFRYTLLKGSDRNG